MRRSSVAEPGEKWSYSNYGFNLLGRVVELVEEKDLSTVLTERITEPLPVVTRDVRVRPSRRRSSE